MTQSRPPLREDLRNLAIIAHVDHGKTTLVDALFRQAGIYRKGQDVLERALDSMDQERERGITILAKVTSVKYGDVTLQLVDTPGHADFGGEVERSLRMVDGVLLLVDAAEGPLPQTRFVLRKALALDLPAVVCINKIDRADARPKAVLDEIYELFIDLGARGSQIDFPVLYTNARSGTAATSHTQSAESLSSLLQAICETVPAPTDTTDSPLAMQLNTLAYDDYVGKLAIGRVAYGDIRTNQVVQVWRGDIAWQSRVTGVYRFHGVQREPLERACAGDIVALAGLDKAAQSVTVGDVIAAPDVERVPSFEPIVVDEPTVAMIFQVNNGPLAGRSGGIYLSSRHLRQRLTKEDYGNVAVRVEPGSQPDQFLVAGRGELQLAVLIESLRREGYEFCVRNPHVVTRRDEQGGIQEPLERLVIDLACEHLGAATELLGRRRSQLLDQRQEGTRARLEVLMPTRGQFGLRSAMLTATRGTAIMHSVFDRWTDWAGPIPRRTTGALVADRAGITTPYALFNLQPRGELFVPPGTEVYEGMVIGENSRANDLNVNVCREKKLTNVRAAGRDDNVQLAPPRNLSLEQALEWIREDEMVEVTPNAIRLRKVVLAASGRSVKAALPC